MFSDISRVCVWFFFAKIVLQMDCVIYEAAMEMEMRNWNRMKTRDYGYLIYRCNLKLAFNLILMHFSLNTLLVTSIARRWLAAEISHNFAHFLRPKRAISEIALTWLFYSSLFFLPPCTTSSLQVKIIEIIACSWLWPSLSQIPTCGYADYRFTP